MDTGAVKRESQISHAFARLDKTIDELNSVAIGHEESLAGILRDNEPEKHEPEQQLTGELSKQEILVPVARALDNFSDRLRIIISKFDSVQRRLEL